MCIYLCVCTDAIAKENKSILSCCMDSADQIQVIRLRSKCFCPLWHLLAQIVDHFKTSCVCVLCFVTGSYFVAQAGLKLTSSTD